MKFYKMLSDMFRFFSVKEKSGDVIYDINNIPILLPVDHALPIYQSKHRLYDRFLPFLSKEVIDGWIVDVGANVGDTAAALATIGSSKKIIAVEPVPYFYSYLEKNIKEISRRGHIVIAKNIAISQVSSIMLIEQKESTAMVSIAGDILVQSYSLDDFLKEMVSDEEKISLIKVDTDGFDYDVLLSGLSVIKKHKPIIYFEAFCTSGESLSCYKKLLFCLDSLGYDYYSVFDNFGQPIMETGVSKVKDLMEYTFFQNQRKSTRTVYYLDILTSTREMRKQHVSSVLSFKEKFSLVL